MSYPQLFVDKVIKSVTEKKNKIKRENKTFLVIKEADIGEDKKYIEPQICFSPNVEF